MSEWFKELVLKTSDSKEPRVRIPVSPPKIPFTSVGGILLFTSYLFTLTSKKIHGGIFVR